MFGRKKPATVLVVVGNGRFEVFGRPGKFWDAVLASMVLREGINKDVEDGYYHFSIKRVGWKFRQSLDPVPKFN